MSKSETKIAEENIKDFTTLATQEHKASCQRFLEFLEEEMRRWQVLNKEISDNYISTGELEEKIQDLKRAIKLYEDNGI